MKILLHMIPAASMVTNMTFSDMFFLGKVSAIVSTAHVSLIFRVDLIQDCLPSQARSPSLIRLHVRSKRGGKFVPLPGQLCSYINTLLVVEEMTFGW